MMIDSRVSPPRIPRLAFYGGSFDPVHTAHLMIAQTLTKLFDLDEFIFIPAFHAPHKRGLQPTSAFDRYAMLSLATNSTSRISVSKIEIEVPAKPYTLETLERLKELLPSSRLYFVMGADSWRDIRTWREWEKVLSMSDHIVVTRPGVEIRTDHVTEEIQDRIIDLRGCEDPVSVDTHGPSRIYLTDSVNLDISATNIRKRIREKDESWSRDVPAEVAKYIEKYQIYS